MGASPRFLGLVTTSVGEAFNECPIFVPTAFTPNGDTRNDFWGVQINPFLQKLNLTFGSDRWGRLLFHARESGERFWWNEGTSTTSDFVPTFTFGNSMPFLWILRIGSM